MPPRKSKNTTDSAWTKLLQTALTSSSECLPPGEGWRTMSEIMEETGRGKAWVHRFLHTSVRSGELEMFNGASYSPEAKRSVRRVWYRPKG